jgi:YD repeat-containing protein
MKKTICLAALMGLFCLNAYGQLSAIIPPTSNGQSKNFIPASPSAAGLGTFGQVPTNNFTGLPQISVPLYTVQYKELSVALGLSYNASGNKPDNFPGSVGLGWSMDAPGAITRVVKGRIDEGGDLPSGSGPVAAITIPYTADTAWSSTPYLSHLLTYSNAETYDNSNPDEYYFNFNGMSGRFYFDQYDSCHVKSSSDLLVKVQKQVLTNKLFYFPHLDQGPLYNSIDTLHSVYKDIVSYKFTLTDKSGVQYIFGGVDNAIEFSRPGFILPAPITANLRNLVNPITWYLTSIKSPNGYQITFTYERGLVVTKAGYTEVYHIEGFAPQVPSVVAGTKSTLINTSILTKITTPKEELTFANSIADQQLDYCCYEPGAYDDGSTYLPDLKNSSWFWQYDDIIRGDTKHKFPSKVDSIVVKDKLGRLCRSVQFTYSSDTSTRLKLLSLKILGAGGTKEAYPQYSFTYNSTPLPQYLSFKTDHYGFYNGRNSYAFLPASDYVSTTFDTTAYKASREPDTALVRAELLTKITYPTGGNTTFVYEPNTYSSYFTTWPFQTSANPSNAELITGGVRIHKIINYDLNNNIIGSKTYHYVKDYANNGTISSGVKAYQPTYFESYTHWPVINPGTITPVGGNYGRPSGYTVIYRKFSVNPIFPMGQTRGNHVTYSEVTEENADGSFVVQKYKNYDNGYGDITPINYVSDNLELKAFYKEDEGISMDLERGQTLSEEYYNAAKSIKKKVSYQYNNDPARFDDHVRVITQGFNSPNDFGVPSIRYTASKIYTYFPYLQEKRDTDYYSNGNAVTKTTYTYDTKYRNLKESVSQASDETIVKTINRYPNEVTNTTDVYQTMINRFMVGPVIETEKQVDGVKQLRGILSYDINLSSNSSLVFPSVGKVQQQSGAVLPKMHYDKYDGMGNILSISQEKGDTVCYVWGYAGLYPVAKIEHTNYSTVESVLGGSTAINTFRDNAFPTDAILNTFLAPLKSDTRLKKAFISTFTYDPMAGMTSSTDAKGLSTYYEYDGMQRLKDIKDKDGNITKYLCYNYAGQTVDCNMPEVVADHMGYCPTTSDICSNSTPLALVTIYSNPNRTLISGFAFYSDRALTVLAPDGYYAALAGGGIGNPRHYLYISGGVCSGVYTSCTIH